MVFAKRRARLERRGRHALAARVEPHDAMRAGEGGSRCRAVAILVDDEEIVRPRLPQNRRA